MPMSGAIGVYDDQVDDSDDGGNVYGVGARFSIMPKFGDNSFLHAGASFYTVDYKGNNHRMRTRMGVHTTGRPFETDRHASDDVDQFGVELAYVNGPFSLQGEFMNVESDGTDNNAACSCNCRTYTAPQAWAGREEETEVRERTVNQVDENDNPVMDEISGDPVRVSMDGIPGDASLPPAKRTILLPQITRDTYLWQMTMKFRH